MSISIGSAPPPRPNTNPKRRTRLDQFTTIWMILALIIGIISIFARAHIPQSWWTTIHILTLGVLTNGILQWSWYFARALLRLPPGNVHAGRHHQIRQVAFNVVLIGLVAAMWSASTWATIATAGLIGLILAWHGGALLVALRSNLASRFAIVIRYYIAAAAALVVGCVYAGIITVAMFAAVVPDWILSARSGLTVAHSIVNVFGWVGLSIAGTLVTLWPTIVRTRMDDAAPHLAVRALPVVGAGLIGATVSATLDLMPGVAAGLAIYAVGLAWGVGIPIVTVLARKRPTGYPGWAVASGVVWVLIGLIWVCVLAWQAGSADDFRAMNLSVIGAIGVGGLAQIFVGALSYLMPVVIGGGPRAVRAGIAVLDTATPIRLLIRNVAILLAITTGGVGPLGKIWWLAAGVVYASDVMAFALAGVKQARVRDQVRSEAAPARSLRAGSESGETDE